MKKFKGITLLENEILTSFYETQHYIRNKYFKMFMAKIGVKQGLDYQQKDYFLRQMWGLGTIASFKLPNTETPETPEGLLILCQYAPFNYNTYDFPTEATLINKRGVPFIPLTPQKIDKDIVIGFAQRNKKPVREIVDYYAKRIAFVESVIQTHMLALKMPFLLATTPENKQRIEKLWNDILADNNVLFVEGDVVDNIKVLNTGTNNQIDKLKSYKDDLENELRESLGFDNLGVHEKKEHLINKEIQANDEITADSGNAIFDCLVEFAEQVKKVLNYTIVFEWQDNEAIETEEEKTPEENKEEAEI